jgi:cellobiose phosphorylase
VAQFLVYAARELVRLATLKKDPEALTRYEEIASSMSSIINDVAWDGGWYIRAFDDFDAPVGSSRNREGKIDMLTQVWAVISGVSDKKRSVKCMEMVRKLLSTEHGIMLCAPPYTEFDPKIGAVGTFAPGLKENGGIFCHANPWAMIAETMLGRGRVAFDYYKKIAPATRNRIPDVHKTEPYVYSQYIAGPAHLEFGRARNSWLTGSAAWNFFAISSYILGVRADYKGLMVDPCVPSTWKAFRVTRRFRGATYDIEVSNPDRMEKGVKSLVVDGKKVNGNIIPPFNDGKTHKVKVVMGLKVSS